MVRTCFGYACCALLSLAAMPAFATVVGFEYMPSFCRARVAKMYAVDASKVRLQPITRTDNRGFVIYGTVDRGGDGVKRFRCDYDAGNKFGSEFKGVTALTGNGE